MKLGSLPHLKQNSGVQQGSTCSDEADLEINRSNSVDEILTENAAQSNDTRVRNKTAELSGDLRRIDLCHENSNAESPSLAAACKEIIDLQSRTQIEANVVIATASPSIIPKNIKPQENAYFLKSISATQATLRKPKVKKAEAACQTEFNDDTELLLRLLRRSPDLLKLVKTMRQATI